jgi:hypothetical protein
VAELHGTGHRVVRMPMEDTAVLRGVATMLERDSGPRIRVHGTRSLSTRSR